MRLLKARPILTHAWEKNRRIEFLPDFDSVSQDTLRGLRFEVVGAVPEFIDYDVVVRCYADDRNWFYALAVESEQETDERKRDEAIVERRGGHVFRCEEKP